MSERRPRGRTSPPTTGKAKRPITPPLSDDRRRKMATRWLVVLSQTPVPERVEDLMPWVDRYSPRSGYAKAADYLVNNGQIPTLTAVQARYEDIKALMARRRAQHLVELSDEEKTLLCDWIDTFAADQGRAPSWREVARHMGWSRQQLEMTMQQLRKQGWIGFTTEPGSLRTTGGATDGTAVS